MRFKSTILSQLLTLVSRTQFQACVDQHQADKAMKGFSCWNQFVVLLYAQLSGKRSLREITAGFNSNCHTHYHLNCGSIKRSTLSDANNKRSYKAYQEVLESLIRSATGQIRSKVSQAIEIFDSTQISLNEALHQWAAKGHCLFGIKAHINYSLQEQLPVYFDMTNANVNDVIMFDRIELKANTLYLFDRGYYDFIGWRSIIDAKAQFITRAKSNLAYEVMSNLPCSDKVIEDQLIQLTSKKNKPLQGITLRKLTVLDKQSKSLSLVTNRLEDSAERIIELYRQRWQIEVFFKWIKQNLKIKRFVGRSENAIRTQLIIAIIAYTLLRLWHHLSHSTINLKYLAASMSDRLMQRLQPNHKPPPRAQYKPSWQGDLALC